MAASAAALIAVTAPGVALGLDKAVHPDELVSGRQAVAFVSQHQHAGDLVLAEPGAPAALTMNFYGPHYDVQARGVFHLGRPRGDGICADPFYKLHHVTRVWLVFAEFSRGQPANRNQIVLARMAAYGKPVLSYSGLDGAGAYLFDLSSPRPHAALAVHPSRFMGCIGIWKPWNGRS